MSEGDLGMWLFVGWVLAIINFVLQGVKNEGSTCNNDN